MARFVIFLILTLSLHADPGLKGQAQYLISKGMISDGIKAYQNMVKATGKDDYELLEQMALSILSQGITTKDPEVQLLALYGASVSMNEKADRFFEEAFRSPYPPIQLAALNAATKNRSEVSNFLLSQAIGAAHPLIRLEAALLMAQRKTPNATIKIESLMQKMESDIHFIFPKLFGMIGDKEAIKILRRMISHSDPKVRSEALIAIGLAGRDDLLREVKKCLNHPDAETVEAAVFAIGAMKEESSIPDLIRLVRSPHANVRLAALNSLYILNQKEALQGIITLAENEDLFAIALLGEHEGGEETLAKLVNSSSSSVRTLAAACLLRHKDERGLKGLTEILIKSPRDLCFVPITSPGGTLKSVKAIPSSRQNLAENPVAFELSLAFREEVLADAFELPEEHSFDIIKTLFQVEQTDLIPLAMELLETHPNEKTIAYLKEQEQKLGSPFIRYYAALTLLSLGEEGPYAEKLLNYLNGIDKIDLVKFRPFVPWELRGEITPYELTPNDHSSLFITSLETFASKREDKGIRLLLELMAEKDNSNRYIIAGLLLRTMQ